MMITMMLITHLVVSKVRRIAADPNLRIVITGYVPHVLVSSLAL